MSDDSPRKRKRIEFYTDKYARSGEFKHKSTFRQPSAYDLDTFLEKDDFKVDWNRRRVRIDLSLIFLGALLAAIIVGMLYSIFREKPIDPNLSYIFSGAIWALLLSFVTILGTYAFGPSFESNNARRAMATMFVSMNNKSNLQGVTATTTTQTDVMPADENRAG